MAANLGEEWSRSYPYRQRKDTHHSRLLRPGQMSVFGRQLSRQSQAGCCLQEVQKVGKAKRYSLNRRIWMQDVSCSLKGWWRVNLADGYNLAHPHSALWWCLLKKYISKASTVWLSLLPGKRNSEKPPLSNTNPSSHHQRRWNTPLVGSITPTPPASAPPASAKTCTATRHIPASSQHLPLQPRAVRPPPLQDLLRVRATGIFLCSSLLIKGHIESSPSPALALTAEPCPARTPSTVGLCDCLWSKSLCWCLCFVGVLVVCFYFNAIPLVKCRSFNKRGTIIQWISLQWEETKKEG